jgi:hypothetical protein
MRPAEEHMPTWSESTWLAVRMGYLRLKRGLDDALHPIPNLSPRPTHPEFLPVASSRTPLNSSQLASERMMDIGKIQNLRLVARELDGLWIPAGATFSFWRQVGRCSRRRGYVPGRQIQAGCIVPTVGGGICQLTNALYELALGSGCEVLERHPHTRLVAGSPLDGKDATVAWNHIDLRWRAPRDMQLRVRLDATSLLVEMLAAPVGRPTKMEPRPNKGRTTLPLLNQADHTCGSCAQVNCHLFERGQIASAERTAYLVEEVCPEFDTMIGNAVEASDEWHLPVDGARRGRSTYAWTTGDAEVKEALLATAIRTLELRRVAGQGAQRQRARQAAFERLARAYVARLDYRATHLVIQLDLLPTLWRAGALGGRTFDVLMTRFPLAEVHRRLDEAAARHPERELLSDFRAPDDLVSYEAEALVAARQLITPHRAIAMDDPRKLLLPWAAAKPEAYRPGDTLVFPGPAAARKGAYEVRDAARALDLPVMLMGSNLEGADFWDGVRLVPRTAHWLDGALAVVQPAVLEDRPRLLLRAAASGCPVVTTEAAGLAGIAGVSLVPGGDVEALVEAIQTIRAATHATSSLAVNASHF